MVRTPFLAAVSALALVAACGQQATTETAESQTAPPTDYVAPAIATLTNAEFAQAVANSDAFELQAAEIATQRSARADVKTFAAAMQADHSATTQELTMLAPSLQLAIPTPVIDANHIAKLDALRSASGESFDDLYLDQQVATHESAVRLFEGYVAGATDGPLRQWAQTTLPKLRAHLERAQGLENAT